MDFRWIEHFRGRNVFGDSARLLGNRSETAARGPFVEGQARESACLLRGTRRNLVDRPWIVFNSRNGTLRFPALLMPATETTASAAPVRTVADQLSLTGFSFRTARPFGIGERLDCVVDVAFSNSSQQLLRVELEVCWIHLNLHGFRIGCRIHESTVVGPGAVPAWARCLVGAGD